MARGTGLPFPKDDAVVQPTPGVNAEAYSSASAWGQIGNAGRVLRDLGVDRLEKAKNQAEIGYLAENETEITRKKIELRDQFARDPDGFDRAWKGYSDGKISESAPWAVRHIQQKLGQEGNSAYGSLLQEKRARDEQLDAKRIKALSDQTADELIGISMAGQLNTPAGEAALLKLQAVNESAVNAGLMTAEEAALRLQNVTSRAGAETVIKSIGDTYRENRAKGLEAGPAALKEAEALLLRTQDPRLQGLSEEERYKYFGKARAEIAALEGERKIDLNAARQATRELQTAMTAGIKPNPDTVDALTEQLTAAGGHADAARLRASVVRQERLSVFGRQPLAEQVRQFGNAAADAGLGARPEVNGAIEAAAAETGLSPSLLRRYARIESGGDPKQVTGSYKGLFQLSDAEFAKYGGGDIFNPGDNAKAAARKMAAEVKGFQTKYGREPTPTDLYLIHQQGEGGYAAHVGNPNRAAWENMASTAEGRQKGAAWAKAAIWGNIPDDIKRRFPGGVESVTSAEFIDLWRRKVGDGTEPGFDMGTMIGQRKAISSKAGEEWAKLTKQMDAGDSPNLADINSVIKAATLTGDHELLEDVAHRVERLNASKVAGRAPLAVQQGAAAELEAEPNLTPGQRAYLADLQNIAKATLEKLSKDPIALGAERFPERIRLPEPLNLANREESMAGLRERAGIARFVGENYGDATLPALGVADRTQVAGAIAGPDPQQAANALDVLASLPDDNFAATLRAPEIKEAISGAARSNDPAKFTAAMMSLDKMWARAPQEFNRLFGEDIVKTVQDWQSKLRYHKPEELAENLRKRDDPQVRERHKAQINEGRREAVKKTIDDLVSDLDPGWFSTGPDVPMDPRTRDAALADYTSLYAERFAETGDKSTAHKQAIERMGLYWKRSELNGGRLTLHAPETVYDAVGGSHAWMKEQITADLRALGINAGTLKGAPVRSEYDRITPTEPSEFVVVADRITEGEISGGRPASYIVMMRNSAGEVDMVRGSNNQPLRYHWQAPKAAARERFQAQRKAVFGANAKQDDSMSGRVGSFWSLKSPPPADAPPAPGTGEKVKKFWSVP